MRTTSKFLAVALTATLQSAMAGTILLDFEDVKNTGPLAGNYNGVTVSGDAWSARSEVAGCGGTVSFNRPGSCGALWLAQDPTSTAEDATKSLTLSIADGFIGSLSFIYSGSVSVPELAVHVFDAAGKELGSGLDSLTAAGCANYLFCNWSQTMTLSFTGVARSVTFSALDQTILLDDLKFTTPTTTPGQLPEPGSIALTLGALAALGWARKRAAAR